MADAISVSAPISGTDKTLTFETGKFALQSQGAVIAKIGKTQVLATANAAKSVRDGIDFFPLTVVPRWLPQRNANRDHRDWCRPSEPTRRACD